MASLTTPLFFQPSDINGAPLAGSRLYFYLTGTSTLSTVYQNSALTTPHTNPVIADASGIFPPIFQGSVLHKVVLKTAADVEIYSIDPFTNIDLLFTEAASAIPESVIPIHAVRHVPKFAIGASPTVITAAVQAAADAAQVSGGVLYFPAGQIYDLNGIVYVKNGVKGIEGEGLIRRASSATGPVGITLAGIWEGESVNVADCTVRGLNIDANNCPNFSNMIAGSNPKNCKFLNITIKNMASGYGINILGHKDRVAPFQLNTNASGNQILGNHITGTLATSIFQPPWYPIGVSQFFDLGIYSGAIDKWKATFAPLTGPYPIVNTTISQNHCEGGTYSISLSGSIRATVFQNFCTGNTRNISCQNGSIANTISYNSCFESFSSAIIVGYGSNSNVIDNNFCYSTVARGESLLQAYIGCKYNSFTNNKTFALDVVGPINHIYFGVHADGNIAQGNRCFGYCQKAYISVESAWNANTTDIASHYYAQDIGDPLFRDWASVATFDVQILYNTINGLSAVPAIHLGQSNGPAVCNLTGTIVHGNTVLGNAYSLQLKVFEGTAGTISGGTLKGNAFDPNALVTRFSAPRGAAHWLCYEDNTFLNGTKQPVTLTPNSVTPSVAHGDVFMCANTVPTTIIDFFIGETAQVAGTAVNGLIRTVRLDINTTLAHSVSLVLKGAVNAVGTSDRWMTFRRNTGRWDEMSRNF